MSLIERRYGVWLYSDRIGTLNQRGDHTWFGFAEEYLEDPNRAVLGLAFEENLRARHSSALRLPPWFSNLLPEGPLLDWIAQERNVSADREMELLAQVGHDLPGAVRVLPEELPPDEFEGTDTGVQSEYSGQDFEGRQGRWRFSLAGVGLKFSMLKIGDRLTLPAYGQGGDWIVKLPDSHYRDVPRNEYVMMSLAGAAGISVPEHLLVPRSELGDLPSEAWMSTEEFAYAVRRFDRTDSRELVHIEDLAQVRNWYSVRKYQGSLNTVAALLYRGRDLASLQEFARRIAFNVLISNGDAHLKNWSLIYRDRRIPLLSPAYDIVATEIYNLGQDQPPNLGMKFDKTRRFDKINLDSFRRLESQLDVRADLVDHVVDTVEKTVSAWPDIAKELADNVELQDFVAQSIKTRSRTLLARRS